MGKRDLVLTSGRCSTNAATISSARAPTTYGQSFPPLSTGLRVPPDVDVDANKDASIPYHRLFVSNLAFTLSPDDIRAVFDPFGEIQFVDLHFNFVSSAFTSSPDLKLTHYVER